MNEIQNGDESPYLAGDADRLAAAEVAVQRSERLVARLTQILAGGKTRVKMALRDHHPYKTVPIEDLITDAAPILAAFVVETMEKAKART